MACPEPGTTGKFKFKAHQRASIGQRARGALVPVSFGVGTRRRRQNPVNSFPSETHVKPSVSIQDPHQLRADMTNSNNTTGDAGQYLSQSAARAIHGIEPLISEAQVAKLLGVSLASPDGGRWGLHRTSSRSGLAGLRTSRATCSRGSKRASALRACATTTTPTITRASSQKQRRNSQSNIKKVP